MLTADSPRADLFRLLGDEDRLRLLALCGDEELTVSELSALLQESQPQTTRKTQPLRDAGLLLSRKDGTRTLLKLAPVHDAVVHAAVDEGRRLAQQDGSLARIPAVMRAREETSRRFFEAHAQQPAPHSPAGVDGALAFLPVLAPLLGRHALAVDVGTGDGVLLPLLSPLFVRVVAIDASPARLATCANVVAARGLPNVRLLEGSVDDALVQETVQRMGFADAVVVSRTLHHAARPQELITACARMLRPEGALLIVDYFAHQDESMREGQGDVWLGFSPEKLAAFAEQAGLVAPRSSSMPPLPGAEDAHLPWQLFVAKKPTVEVVVQ